MSVKTIYYDYSKIYIGEINNFIADEWKQKEADAFCASRFPKFSGKIRRYILKKIVNRLIQCILTFCLCLCSLLCTDKKQRPEILS